MKFMQMISAVAGISSSAAIYSFKALQAKELVDCHECHMKRLPKAKELPLYKEDGFSVECDKQTKLPLLSEISGVRQQIFGLGSYLSGFREEVAHIYETGIAHTQSSYNYITSEENTIPRILAITSGGITGYILTRKRGLFKKLVFISVGTGLVFTAFYPALTKEYALTGWEYVKHNTNNALEKYGGYDTKKLAEETNEKVELIKSTLKLEGLTNKFKYWFEENKEKVKKPSNEVTNGNKTKGQEISS